MERAETTLSERITPQSSEAEQATLGGAMLDRDALARTVEILTPDDFYFDAHKRVFEALCNLFGKAQPVDLITTVEELRRIGQLDQVGGPSYIGTLIESCPSTANIDDYARIVEEKAVLRNLIAASHQIAGWAYQAGSGVSNGADNKEASDLDSVLDRAEGTIFSIGQRRMGSFFEPMAQLVRQVYDNIDKQFRHQGMATGISTGFNDLDAYTTGLQPSDLIVIAGRPGMGKTALSLCIAENIAVKQKEVAAIFSLEMSKEQLVQRMICSAGNIDSHRLRSGHLREKEDWPKVAEAVQTLYDAPLFIDDTPSLSPFEMRAKARRLKAEHGLALIIIDYMQLVRPPRGRESRVQEVSEIARSLKTLARELQVPVIALSQLSRAVEQRESRRPVLSDLRDSGAIEAEADVVAFIYREAYYESIRHKQAEPEESSAEIIIAKQRNGPTGSVELSFIPRYAKFAMLERNRTEE